MKMAKASEADLEMAMELCSALESLTQRWYPTMPEKIERLTGDEESEGFELHSAEQCERVLRYLLELANSASLMRVVFGASVMLDPRNKCVDANADTLEHHPDVQRYEWIRENFTSMEFKRGDARLHIENGDAPDKLDVLIDELRVMVPIATGNGSHTEFTLLPDPLGCRACTHPDCGRFDGPRQVECRAMADNACARPGLGQ